MTELNIKDLLAEEEKTIWVKYLDDFEINIRYLPRRELIKISERSTEIGFDKRTHIRTDKVNSEKFYERFVEKVILGWRGLTLKTLSKMIAIKTDGIDLEQEVPFTKENAIQILRDAYDFDAFVNDAIMDIQRFDIETIEAEKKTA